MAKALRCYLGFHRWRYVQVQDGVNYEKCRACGKERISPPWYRTGWPEQ
jgi:hypothetical protein